MEIGDERWWRGKGTEGEGEDREIGSYKQNYYKELIHVIIDAKKFQGLLLESWNPRKAVSFHLGLNLKVKDQNPNPIRQGKKKLVITRHHSKREQAHAASTFFCSMETFNQVNKPCSHWGEQSALLNPPTPNSMPSGNTLTDTPRMSTGHLAVA